MAILLHLCFPQIRSHDGLFEGALICKNEFLCGAYSRGEYLEVGPYLRIYGIWFVLIKDVYKQGRKPQYSCVKM